MRWKHVLEMTGEYHTLSVTCLWAEQIDLREPSSRAEPHCEKWAGRVQLPLCTTRGQAGPLAILERPSLPLKPELR